MTYFEAGEWPVSYVGTGCSSFTDDTVGQDEFENMAANLLWNWSSRIYGLITETIRPQRVAMPWRPTYFEGRGPVSSFWNIAASTGWGWLPIYNATGDWVALGCGLCGLSQCDHDPLEQFSLRLPGPVDAIVSVTIDGAVLDPTLYRLDNQNTLIRQDGTPWPQDQDLTKPLTAVNTWSIQFTRGVPVPMGGQIAAGLLACELYKAATNDDSCALPSRVQSVTRQGVSMQIVQTTFADAQDGKTGLWLVDSWVGSVMTKRDYAGVAFPGQRHPGVSQRQQADWDLGYRR